MPDITRVNSTIYSWTSLIHKLDNQPWVGIVAADFSQKRERKIVHAARRDGRPLGRTSGKYQVDSFTMKFLVDSWNAFTDYLSIKGNGSYGDAEWDYLLQIAEPVTGAKPITHLVQNCVIVGEKEGHEEGIDEVVVEAEIQALTLSTNGKRLWSALRGL